jgi:hypothetical protein
MVLVYINSLNKNYKGQETYEFLFAKNNEINFGDDWDIMPASSGVVTPPPVDEIDMVGVLITNEIELELANTSDNFSMYDCVENIVALAWEKETPMDDMIRLVFHFGENIESVKEKLYSRDKIMKFIKELENEKK